MFLSSWSIALSLASLLVLALLAVAARTAVRVLLHWDPSRDDNQQIRLENEIWLSSTLVEYALGFQLLSLVLFVLAADSYGQVIVGAMCATGALLANDYGMPLLLIKLAGVFFYGYWIVLHQLDIRAETYPLVRVKYCYLLVLLGLVLADITLQALYIGNLSPDIITSCCAVVFGKSAGGGPNLVGVMSQESVLQLFYGGTLLVAGLQLSQLRWPFLRSLIAAGAAAWIFYFVVALLAVTAVFSSYVYAMPYHKCPFCILKAEYGHIGFVIYGALIGATFCGVLPAVVAPVGRFRELAGVVGGLQRRAAQLALLLLVLLVLASSFHLVRYLAGGGEG